MSDNFVDFFKDIFGVMDDANDYAEEVQDILKKLQPLFDRLERAGDDLGDRLEEARKADDLKKMKALLVGADFETPGVLGKTIRKKLSEAWSKTKDLEQSLRKLPPEIRRNAEKHVERAEDKIGVIIKENKKMLSEISKVQREVRSHARKIAKYVATGVLVVTGSAGVAYAFGTAIKTAVVGAFVRVATNMASDAAGHLASSSVASVRDLEQYQSSPNFVGDYDLPQYNPGGN